MTALELFISQHQLLSYLIIFVGVLAVEADLFFLTGAIFADQKHLNWLVLIAVAFAAVILGDLIFYYFGRYAEKTRIGRWLNRKFRKQETWIDENFLPRYPRIIFFTKFLYYINRLMPFLAGWQRMPQKQFLKIHLIADLGWLLTITTIGAGLGGLVNIVGAKWILERMWLFFLVLALVFVGGEYLLKRLFTKKFRKRLFGA